jgi:hypothetical protein
VTFMPVLVILISILNSSRESSALTAGAFPCARLDGYQRSFRPLRESPIL